jgi:hypothetical protein
MNIYNRIKRKDKYQVVKNKLITRWRLRRSILIQAIKEIKRGECITCNSIEEMMRELNS